MGESGPFVVHNCVQHLARNIIADNMLAFDKTEYGKKYRPAHTVHDELIYVVDEADAEGVLDTLNELMKTPPTWWPELVTSAEGDIAQTYGGAK